MSRRRFKDILTSEDPGNNSKLLILIVIQLSGDLVHSIQGESRNIFSWSLHVKESSINFGGMGLLAEVFS